MTSLKMLLILLSILAVLEKVHAGNSDIRIDRNRPFKPLCSEGCISKGGKKCAFPVKYKDGNTYTSCGKNGYTKNWCPTALKPSGEYKDWDECYPTEDDPTKLSEELCDFGEQHVYFV